MRERGQLLLASASAAALAALPGHKALAQSGDVTLPIVSDRKFEGQTVIVTSEAGPPISGPIQHFGHIWEEATGATIDLVTYPHGEFFEKLRTELVSGADTSDLVNFQSGWSGDFIGGGEYYNKLDTATSRFMAGEISAEEAMESASDEWERTTDRLGRDHQRELYLASTAG